MSTSDRCWSCGSSRGSCASNHDKGFERDEVETVGSMVSMLSCQDSSTAQRILLAMTGSAESCQALRKAGCISLLIQTLHPCNVPLEDQPSSQTKSRAAQALKNIVQFNGDERAKRKEMRVLKLLEPLRSYIENLKSRVHLESAGSPEQHPISSSAVLMRFSYDEDHRNVMCLLGAIQTLADLLQTDHAMHGINDLPECNTMRRYVGMTLTNLSVGDKRVKSLLGTMREFMAALAAQLDSPCEDVCQAMASLLRNLSWHASSALRASLSDSNAVRKLVLAAIKAKKETTLKPALSALWNLSAHSHANKIAICQIPDSIDFLVSLLESRTLEIIQNAGGVLTNISIVTTTDPNTRDRFRACGILEILLDHLQSSCIVVVGNACGMLWHLSSCEINQEKLIQLGAVRKLKVLAGSKHERIKQGACSTLRNLLTGREIVPAAMSSTHHQTESLHKNLLFPKELEQQQPMDLRKSAVSASRPPMDSVESALQKPSDLQLLSEPLDLSIHSSKSTPIHTVSAGEFGPRCGSASSTNKGKRPFLNPPLQNKNAFSYDSPKSYNSCPEFVGYLIQPAHTGPVDMSQDIGGQHEGLVTRESTLEDTTINYSLHFPELGEDPVVTKSEDTVKTYYCEGTPLNFSTSNSMNDLTLVEKPVKLKPIIETEASDDLPRKYCTESTPATFSRASSLSSIASNLQGGENKVEYFDEAGPKLTNGGFSAGNKEKGKRNVTFSAADTPLMFSRTSSVNSLDSIDINYEDTGSVASEFSRRVSEAVSPSELPDSPRQIPPPKSMSFPVLENGQDKDEDTVKVFATAGESCAVSGAVSVRSLSPLTIDGDETRISFRETLEDNKENVSEPHVSPSEKQGGDETRVFGVEDTPWHGVSTASSLSDLGCEIEKETEETLKDLGNEKEGVEPPRLVSPPPPPLPPKPKTAAKPKVRLEPVYVDTAAFPASQTQAKTSRSPPRLPKSKSEVSKLNTKAIKMSTSYHENLKRENQLDPELAELILKGKSRVKGAKVTGSNPVNGKVSEEKKSAKQSRSTAAAAMTDEIKKTVEKSPNSSKVEPNESTSNMKSPAKSQVVNQNQMSTTSMGSEWNQDTLSLSVPSLSINGAFKLAMSADLTATSDDKVKGQEECPQMTPLVGTIGILETSNMVLQQSTGSNIQIDGPSEGVIFKKCKISESNLFNQKAPPEFDLDSSMMSVASLKTEVASVGPLEEGMRQLSIDGDTYTAGGCGSDLNLTDAEESFLDDCDSDPNTTSGFDDKRIEQNDNAAERFSTPPQTTAERCLTYTSTKHASPKQKRKDDPNRYLTRTILAPGLSLSPKDTNGNHSPPTFLSTFRGDRDRAPRIVKPSVSATSNESSPNTSPKGIRGRRKQLYSSLPPQKRHGHGPPVPPKPLGNGGSPTALLVRPTRASELRAASSRDTSPKNSSKNSSNSSLNNMGQGPTPSSGGSLAGLSHQNRKTPPKPPVRSSQSSSFRNFAVVRAVRNSNSSIGFSTGGEPAVGAESPYRTLPRSLKCSPVVQGSHTGHVKEVSKVGKITAMWNKITKGISKHEQTGTVENSGTGSDKKQKFGISFTRKKHKENCSATVSTNWISCPENGNAALSIDSSDVNKSGKGQHPKQEREATPSGSRMTPV